MEVSVHITSVKGYVRSSHLPKNGDLCQVKTRLLAADPTRNFQFLKLCVLQQKRGERDQLICQTSRMSQNCAMYKIRIFFFEKKKKLMQRKKDNKSNSLG